MPFLTTIASGSSGNCAVLSDGKTHILIDAGVSARRITAGLREYGIRPGELAGVLITHEHIDHVKGLSVLYKQIKAPLYMSRGTANGVLEKAPCLHNYFSEIAAGSSFEIGNIGIEAFATPHDTPESLGFTFFVGKKKLGYATDLGCVTEEVRQSVEGCDCLFIEANHDLFSLVNGPYPEYLKHRILSRRGHLSNIDCADLVRDIVSGGARRITLCHLSRENNTPALAADEINAALSELGASLEDGIEVTVAPPDGADRPYNF